MDVHSAARPVLSSLLYPPVPNALTVHHILIPVSETVSLERNQEGSVTIRTARCRPSSTPTASIGAPLLASSYRWVPS